MFKKGLDVREIALVVLEVVRRDIGKRGTGDS